MVNFCMVGLDPAQMTDCWCREDRGGGVYRENGCLVEHLGAGGAGGSLPEDCLRGADGENSYRRYPLCRVLED